MTVSTTETGGGLAQYGEYADDIGLEDVDASDLAIPRVKIDHARGVFVNSLSGEEFSELNCVILGLVKQRVYWRGEIDEGDKPACKSPNNVYGFPNNHPKQDVDKQFPWDESNFTQSDLQLIELAPDPRSSFPEGWSSNGHGALSCDACVFSQWSKGTGGKNTPPPCAEQHTFPIMYLDSEGSMVTAILTLQKTGIKPSRQYLSSFAQTRTPMFTVWTNIKLNANKRGMVTYQVPALSRSVATDREQWDVFAGTFRTVRAGLRAAPRVNEDGDGSTPPAPASSNENVAPQAAAAPVQEAKQEAAPAASPSPSPSPSPAPAPAPAAPVQEAPSAPATATEPAPATPAPSPSPSPSPAPSAPVAAAPAAAPADDDDDLPF